MKIAIALMASVAALGTLAAAPAAAQSESASATAERSQRSTRAAILKWHEEALNTHALTTTVAAFRQNGGPLRTTRGWAMTQIAVFDAVNAFNGRFSSYNSIAPAQRGASIEVAIAYAAHNVLASVWNAQSARLAQVLADDLAAINASPQALARGRAVGEAAAAAIIARRTNDGSQIPDVNWGQGGRVATGNRDARGNLINSGQDGSLDWIPDPISIGEGNPVAALGSSWGAVTPFALRSGAQFRARPFPTPGTRRYREQFNDVKAVGAAPGTPGGTGTARTQFIGNYWGYEGTPGLGAPPRIYAQIAVELAETANINNPQELARYLALAHVSMADAGITVWDTKYFYNIGRPVTVIRADDGDPATVNDPTWTPYGLSQANRAVQFATRITPPFPAYSSGHATFGSAVFETARQFMPNNTAFTFTSDEYNGTTTDPFTPGVPRPLVPVRYRSLSEAEIENGRSRVFNGVHWQLDSDVGIQQGQQTARFAGNTLFRRR
jgi:hypothetical protein